MIFCCDPNCQGVSFTGNGDSLASDGVCKHYTKRTFSSHSRTRDFFSRGSRLESSSQQEAFVSHKSVVLTSCTACRTRSRGCFLHTWALLHFPRALQSDFPSDHLPDLRGCPLHTEMYPCADPTNVSFGPLAETHSPTDVDGAEAAMSRAA